ncbi:MULTISPECIES: tetratricopeptide repeat protein [Streptomyces]|uniref:Tetratricopeptide repeat protein n=1 Tax=Streptomyces fimbriatus TaxID=68197 RepID=A0ABW0DHM0_STRFI
MHDEQAGYSPDSALAELRRRLEAGLARARLKKTDLVARTGLSRTTVQLAFQTDGPVPSTQTVTALARALKLPMEELQALQRIAAGDGSSDRPGPGQPIGQWDPHALEVHPAGTARDGTGLPGQRLLPGYVPREHDQVLAEAVRDAAAGRSRMLVLVGSSSTGKTRACWEAVQPLAEQGWRLWHPFDPTRAEAALEDLARVAPQTVVWLNEAQHYLGDPGAGERIAAALHTLLTTPERAPVLVLGTLWPDYAKEYTALPTPGGPDPHSRVRELLAGRTVRIPEAFDDRALAEARVKADRGDRLLADALTRAGKDGRLAQDLAGGPAILERYQTGSPAARALLEAAMDARRLGVGLHLPRAFLTDAAADYLHDTDWNQLTDDWAEKAYAELAEHVHGKHAPLSRITPRPQRRPPGPSPDSVPLPRLTGPVFRLADYLEQHGRTIRRPLCPPASFWHAAYTHLTHPDDLDNLTMAAETRYRLQWAHHLRHRAAEHGSTNALQHLAEIREEARDREDAENLYRQAVDHGSTDALWRLAVMREEAGDRESAEDLARQAVDRGSTDALWRLAVMREEAGDRESAENLARQAADHGKSFALYRLAEMREEAGDRESAEDLAQQAADRGSTNALYRLAVMREEAGDVESAKNLYWQAADRGNTGALYRLAEMREKAGDRESAKNLYRQAVDHGSTDALWRLVVMREEAGDREGAEGLARQATDHGSTNALHRLAVMREKAGERESAEGLARTAADHGNPGALYHLAVMREEAGDRESAEDLARQAADHGESFALYRLAVMREGAGDREGAENLARQAADHGSTNALYRLAVMREEAGDVESAEDLARQTADHGSTDALYHLAVMREGAGERKSAEDLARQAADHGSTDALYRLAEMREKAGEGKGAEDLYHQAANRGAGNLWVHIAHTGALAERWPNGLDPDGTPTPPWR